ncbi:DUF1499 domain-containing protein [Halomonas piscis]|uniref:DUF1499 domain-containing protein n=1 Tax=Halomonas piscis TaxID=3031727 RepID=A0ABY9Z308_9GAMM|nr:DUF1499 domain-containing protein [Halomonas piscis]WNK21066.1 DUF1499 domain-containing protein [Halomonas piscis]
MAHQPIIDRPAKSRWPRRLAWLSVILLLASAVLIAAAGPAYRMEVLALGNAFSLLRYATYAAVAAAALGLVTLITAALKRRFGSGFTAVLVMAAAVALLYVPWQHWQRAQAVPAIHDITTDMDNPPAFEAVAEARKEAPNEVDYPGESTAEQQRAAYPEVQPLELDAPLKTVLAAAQAEMQDAGWQIADVGARRIEATATTRWFGFKDDVVVRLSEEDDATRVDMRSASRLGKSDVGTNAARVHDFLESLEARLGKG